MAKTIQDLIKHQATWAIRSLPDPFVNWWDFLTTRQREILVLKAGINYEQMCLNAERLSIDDQRKLITAARELKAELAAEEKVAA